MRRVEPHKHTFTFPVASKEDVQAGASFDLIVTPASLGTAAVLNKEDFATSEHGGKLDEIYADAKSIPGIKENVSALQKSTEEIKKTAELAEDIAENAENVAGRVQNKVNQIEGDIESLHIISNQAKERAQHALDGLMDLGDLAKKNKVELTDLDAAGTVDGEHVLTGSGWVEIAETSGGLSPLDRGRLGKIDDLEAKVAELKVLGDKLHESITEDVDFKRVDSAASAAQVLAQTAHDTAETAQTKADDAYALANQTAQESKKCCDKAEAAQNSVTELAGRVTNLSNEVSQNDTEIKQLRKEADEAKQAAIGADAKISALEAASTDAGKAAEALKKLQDELTAAKTAGDQAKSAADRVGAQAEANKGRLDGFDIELAKVNTAIGEAKQAAQRAEQKATESDTHAGQAQTAADAADRKVTDLSARVTQVAKTANDANTLAEGTKEALDKAAKEITDTKGLVANAVTAARNAETVSRASEENYRKTTDRINAIAQQAQQSDTTAKAAVTKVDALEKRLEAKEACCDDIAETKQKLKTAEDKVTALEGRADGIDGKVGALEGKVTELENRAPAQPAPAQPAAKENFYDDNNMGDKDAMHALIEEQRGKVEAAVTEMKLRKHHTAGFEYDSRWAHVKPYAGKPAGWLKSVKDIAVELTDVAIEQQHLKARFEYVEDIITMARFTQLSRSTPFLVAKKGNADTDRRRLTLKAGTLISVGLEHKKGHLVINTEREISHGVGNLQDQMKPGTDHYVLALIDWDREDEPEVTFSIQDNLHPPRGYDASSYLVIGGFHTLCADVGVIANHPLSGYKAGDILPQSVWCANHRPSCSPQGMVYHPSRHFWIDIYPQSGSGANARSKYNAPMHFSSRNDMALDLYMVGKRFPTDEEFVSAVYGTPTGSKVSTALTTAGGHTGTNNKRIISNIGVEDGFGVISQYLGDVYAMAGTTTGRSGGYVIRALAAGGSNADTDAGLFYRIGGIQRRVKQDRIGARGVCESRRA